MVGVVVLVLAVGGAIVIIDRLPARRLEALTGLSVTVSDLHPTTTVQASPVPTGDRSEQVQALSLGTVAVQTFAGSVLVRSGSGTAVSSDGLILTTSGVAPYGSGSFVYQIATADGGLLRASRAYSDASGLVLLKVQSSGLNAVLFDDRTTITAGTEVTIAAAFLRLAQFTPLLISATVPYVTTADDIPLAVDHSFIPLLAGARVFDREGHSLGVVQLGGAYPRMISAPHINDFVNKYLARAPKP
jgi:hypothetical protein